MQTDPHKADSPKRKRRWFQFSLRTLLIVVTLLSLPCAFVGSQLNIVRERSAMRKRLLAEGALLKPPDAKAGHPSNSPSWLRRFLGDNNTPAICRPQARDDIEDEQVEMTFPEAELSSYFTLIQRRSRSHNSAALHAGGRVSVQITHHLTFLPPSAIRRGGEYTCGGTADPLPAVEHDEMCRQRASRTEVPRCDSFVFVSRSSTLASRLALIIQVDRGLPATGRNCTVA